MVLQHDILAELAAIDPNSSLAKARQQRAAATQHIQGSYQVLFSQQDVDFPLTERTTLAAAVAAWHHETALQTHYVQRAGVITDTPRLLAAKVFAERLTFSPVDATAAHLQALQTAGWTLDSIVTLAQLVAFVSFQSRLLQGYRLLRDDATRAVAASTKENARAGGWHTTPHTVSGQPAPTAFTQQELGWEPWIAAKPLAVFSDEEQTTLAHFGHSNSDYFRLLARNLPLLEQRTLTDKGIFYTSGGLTRAERELAATVTSKVNGCIYCASVHARKTSQLSKQTEAVQQLLRVAPGALLSPGQSPRWQAEIEFTAALAITPPVVNPRHLQALRQQGLDTLEQLDLLQAGAFFAWANRLMLTLGEPFLPPSLKDPHD